MQARRWFVLLCLNHEKLASIDATESKWWKQKYVLIEVEKIGGTLSEGEEGRAWQSQKDSRGEMINQKIKFVNKTHTIIFFQGESYPLTLHSKWLRTISNFV